MYTLDTSAKPSRRSEEALLNSAASIRPRSIAETISPPGSAFTAAPIPEHVNGEADGAELEALEIFGLGDRFLVPAERLRVHRSVRKRDDVQSERCIQLGEKLLAAAVFVPGQQHVGIHRVARTRTPQRQGVLLAIMIDEHAVAAVERCLRPG